MSKLIRKILKSFAVMTLVVSGGSFASEPPVLGSFPNEGYLIGEYVNGSRKDTVSINVPSASDPDTPNGQLEATWTVSTSEAIGSKISLELGNDTLNGPGTITGSANRALKINLEEPSEDGDASYTVKLVLSDGVNDSAPGYTMVKAIGSYTPTLDDFYETTYTIGDYDDNGNRLNWVEIPLNNPTSVDTGASDLTLEWLVDGGDPQESPLSLNYNPNDLSEPLRVSSSLSSTEKFYTLTARITNQFDQSAEKSVTLHVRSNKTNEPPTLEPFPDDDYEVGEYQGQTRNTTLQVYLNNPQDPDGDMTTMEVRWDIGGKIGNSEIEFEYSADEPFSPLTITAVDKNEPTQYTITATLIDEAGDSASQSFTLMVNPTPPPGEAHSPSFDFEADTYVVSESTDRNQHETIIPLVDPDDPNSGSQSLRVEWVATKTVGAGMQDEADIELEYNPNDVSTPLVVRAIGDVVREERYTLTAKVTDPSGITTEKSLVLRVNPTAEFEIVRVDPVYSQAFHNGTDGNYMHEGGEANFRIENVDDPNGSIDTVEWELIERDGAAIKKSEPTNSLRGYVFQVGNINERKEIVLRATVRDNDGGISSQTVTTTVNAAPEITVVAPGLVSRDGMYFLEETEGDYGNFAFNMGDGDTISGDNESGTHDPDGTVVRIDWDLIEGPTNKMDWSLEGGWDGVTPELAYNGFREVVGKIHEDMLTYKWRIEVEDNEGATSERIVTLYSNSRPILDEVELEGDAISLKDYGTGFAGIKDSTGEDLDQGIVDIKWEQLDGPKIRFVEQGQRYVQFATMNKLNGGGGIKVKIRVTIFDDLGVREEGEIEIEFKEVFNTCGDILEDEFYPPGGDCVLNEILGHGVMISGKNNCSSLVSGLWIPAPLDGPSMRSDLLTGCDDRAAAECENCIPPEVEESEYEECQLLPVMMPPKMLAYQLDEASGTISVETNFGTNNPRDRLNGIPQPEDVYNPNANYADWAGSMAEYEQMYFDRDTYPASRCLDVSPHKLRTGSLGPEIDFVVEPEADMDAMHPQDMYACWKWDLQYNCSEPVVNTCKEWETASSFVGAAPQGWEMKGKTDTHVDNYLYWLFRETGEHLDSDGIPKGAVLYEKIHMAGNARWKMECRNEATGEPVQELGDTFCPEDPETGHPLLLECLPGSPQRITSLGAMPVDDAGNVIEQSIQRCIDQVVQVPGDCHYGAIAQLQNELNALVPDDIYFDEMTISILASTLEAVSPCTRDPNDTDTLIKDLNDSPYVLNGDWEDGATNGKDDCWKWESRWKFYSGDTFQWCTITCSDGTSGVKQELVGCELIDPTMAPVPEWEQWGEGWSRCAAPVIKTICPMDMSETLTISGEPAGTGDLAGIVCTDPAGVVETTETGEVISSYLGYECYDSSTSPASCVPNPNCELVGVSVIDGNNDGVPEYQHQEYVCEEEIEVCEHVIEEEICFDHEDFLIAHPPKSNFERAVAGSKFIDGAARDVAVMEDMIRIFPGDKIKCMVFTPIAIALYNHIQAVLVYLSVVSAGTISTALAVAIAAVGAAELLASQEYLFQKMECCNPDPDIVSKKVEVESLVSMAINAIMGAESQGKIPACNGKEIKLANKRYEDARNGNQQIGTSFGYYYEGSAIRIDGKMSASLVDDFTLPNPLIPTEDIALTKKQEWCTFSNILSRIIQVNGRDQLKQMAIAGAAGSQAYEVEFNFVGSEDDYGWKYLDNINGTKVAYYQWNPKCFTEAHNEAIQRGYMTCPWDFDNVWTAYCTSNNCDINELKGTDLSSPSDDWDPRRGSKGTWDMVVNERHDQGVKAMTKYVVKKGQCSQYGVCNWDFYAWPSTGGNANLVFDFPFAMYNSNGVTEEYQVGSKFKFEVELPPIGAPWPNQLKLRYAPKEDVGMVWRTKMIPTKINELEGIELPGVDGAKVFGGCEKERMGCGYRFVVPVQVEAIPEDSCSGFTVDQLMVLDFAKMDFGEYIDLIIADFEETELSEQEIANLANQMLSIYTQKVIDSAVIESNRGAIVGNFSELEVVGPQMVQLAFSQQLPFDMGFVESIDINWDDGSPADVGINKESLLNLWNKRRDDAVNKYTSVCVPRYDDYLDEKARLQGVMNDSWADFHYCVTGQESGSRVGYEVSDLSDMDIQKCPVEYDRYELDRNAWKEYVCLDRMNGNKEDLCPGQSSKDPECIKEMLSHKATCGTDALGEINTYEGCRNQMEHTVETRDRYAEEHQKRIEEGRHVIMWEHIVRTTSEDREMNVSVVAHLASGGTQTMNGVIANYAEKFNDNISLRPRHIRATDTKEIRADDPTAAMPGKNMNGATVPIPYATEISEAEHKDSAKEFLEGVKTDIDTHVHIPSEED